MLHQTGVGPRQLAELAVRQRLRQRRRARGRHERVLLARQRQRGLLDGRQPLRRVVVEEGARLAGVGVVLRGMGVARGAPDGLAAARGVVQQRGGVEPGRGEREGLLAAEAGAARVRPALRDEALASVRARRRADEHEALDERGARGGQFEGDGRAHAVPGHGGALHAEAVQQLGGVVGHARDGVGLVGRARAARAAVVEGNDAASAREGGDVRGPEAGVAAEPGEQEDGRALARVLVPGHDVAQLDVGHDAPAYARARLRSTRPRRSASATIWSTLVAAPLRMLSVTAQKAMPPGREASARTRPTSTSSLPAASRGVG